MGDSKKKKTTAKPTEEPPKLSRDQEFQQLQAAYCSAETDLAHLLSLLSSLEKDEISDGLLEECPELLEVYQKNEKLKYRKQMLQKSLAAQEAENKKKGIATPKKSEQKPNGQPAAKKAKEEEKPKDTRVGGAAPKQTKKYDYVQIEDFGSSLLSRLNNIFKQAIAKAFPSVNAPLLLTEATNTKFGDYQCNSAMGICAKLKAEGIKKTPKEIAEEIVKSVDECPLISKIEVAPSGYINIHLNVAFVSKQIGEFSRHGVTLPKIARRRVAVDFSSPNIAKEMHVGHLRSTIIGDSVCRLLEAVNFEVIRINHIGDWGTQFGMLIAYLYEKYPDFVQNPPPIGEIQAFYKESKKRFDEDPSFKERSLQMVVRLQAYDPDVLTAWRLCCDITKKSNNELYTRLDIVINDKGESFYQERMNDVVKELTERNVLEIEDTGRKLLFPAGCDVPLVVVKSDGGYTYATSDLATIKYRLNEEKADWLIYVVDAGQNLHLESIYAVARDLGWYDPAERRVEHVAFGLVLGEDKKKFKTRSGETVRLLDLINEGVRRAEEKLIEKGRDKEMTVEELAASRDAVAYGSIKYADLSHTRTQDYVFSFDRMLDDRGNTAVYLLYAYARIRSIVRQSGVSDAEIAKYSAENDLIPLDHPKEVKLAKQILKLCDVILAVLDSLMLHTLCDYVYALSTVFSEFYSECYVVEKIDGKQKVNMNRLVLADVTANTMEKVLRILGIRPVQKM